jgi:hypothetical protein
VQSGKAKAPAKKGVAAKKAAPAAAKAGSHLYPSTPKNLRIGGDVRPKRDLSRFVKWPRYVRVQRQKRILFERLKVPPAINQFRKALDRAEALPVFKLLVRRCARVGCCRSCAPCRMPAHGTALPRRSFCFRQCSHAGGAQAPPRRCCAASAASLAAAPQRTSAHATTRAPRLATPLHAPRARLAGQVHA